MVDFIPPSLDLASFGVNITEILDLRHAIHEEPEIAFTEYKTREKLRKFLESKGATKEMFREMAKTGFVLDIQGTKKEEGSKREPRIIGIRTDIDALPIVEGCKDLPYRSKTEGVAHLCGHDGHMAMISGAAWAFLNNRHKLPSTSTIRLIFEPAEEIGQGAKLMIKDGAIEEVSAIYGMHGFGNKLGTICVHEGEFTTYLSAITIKIKGEGAHTSTPFKAKDPIPCACAIHTALSSLVPRTLSKDEFGVIGIGMFNAGTVNNQLPSTAQLKGTIRSYGIETLQLLEMKVGEIVKNLGNVYGVEAQLLRDHDEVKGVNNWKNETQFMREVGCELVGEENVLDVPMEFTEDFGEFVHRIPGTFICLGGGEPGRQTNLHHPDMNFNDKSIPTGISIWIKIAQKELGFDL